MLWRRGVSRSELLVQLTTEGAVATRNVIQQATALAKARERRRALDRARDEQDQRIEEAAAEALVALELRVDAERALKYSTSQLGEALIVLLSEGVSMDKAAALVELEVPEVRRLVRAAAPAAALPAS